MQIHVPFRKDKNIGKAYNDVFRRSNALPSEWMVVCEYDALFLSPNFYNIIERAIDRYGEEYSVFTARTNRIGLKDIRIPEVFFNESDINVIYNKAREIEVDETVTEVECVPGMCIITKPSTWVKAGGFKENSVYFDRIFSDKVKAMGGKIGVINGLAMLHMYRWGVDEDLAPYKSNHLI